MAYLSNYPTIPPGNIIPSEWYQNFTNNRGAPDLSLISVLSEIVYWYRPKRVKDSNTGDIAYINKFLGDTWQTSYEHFEKKFGFNREKLRRIFVKLEQMGICSREFRNVKLRGQTYNNRLFIHLSSNFLNSCASNKRKISDCENYKINCNTSFSTPKEEGGYPHFEGDHIIDTKNKNIIKDRSIKSNFYKNSLEEEIQTNLSCNKTQESRGLETTNQIKSNSTKPKTLLDFYPLNAKDCSELQSLSSRQFSLHAMNEILQDMSKRLTDRMFSSKQSFINYMSMAFMYEKRQAEMINNQSFRIKSNLANSEIETREQEKYLAEIEYNLQVSPEWHLKKKLAAVLESSKAYNLLKAYNKISRVGGTLKIHLDKPVELTESDHEIILKQAKATHERLNEATGAIEQIERIVIIIPEVNNTGQGKLCETQRVGYESPVEPELPNGVWGNIRKDLIKQYGSAIDNNWFSKLSAEIDDTNKLVKLTAPSEFVKDWVERNYNHQIERFFNCENYNYVLC